MVVEAIDRWAEATLSSLPTNTTIEAYAIEFLSQTSLMATVQELTPDLAEEVRGIAEGSGVPFNLIAAYNLMDEQWWYEFGRKEEPGCSTFSKRLENGQLLAQHMDLPSYMDGSQLILHVDDGEKESLILSSAGLIGLTGASRAGFGICVNTLLMLNHSSKGLPVAEHCHGVDPA